MSTLDMQITSDFQVEGVVRYDVARRLLKVVCVKFWLMQGSESHFWQNLANNLKYRDGMSIVHLCTAP